ncbi:unnamed protein product [Meganyctiphanes norvegica]|uniref:RING-type domain-containing protein n=1 Tax=Meganyctiphanes norvegica TaxID=48144 RepID=A0AAV2PMM9_MEGNR
MGQLNAPIDCGICLEEYDEIRRPRSLPCAHHVCSPCLQKHITFGGNKCSICSRAYTAISVDEFPINTDLEKMIQLWSHMSVNAARTNESSDEEDDFTNGYCSIHKKSLVYFRCKTHGIYICHQCAVIEHSPSKCDIIEIKEEMLKTKEDNLSKAHVRIVHLNSKTVTLESMIVEKRDNISKKKVQFNRLLREIDDDSKVCDQAQKSISENNNMKEQLLDCIVRLNQANTSKKINKECLAIQVKLEGRNDTEKNAKPLTKVSRPVSDAGAGVHVVIYFDLQGDGRPLGRVKILLTCGPKSRQEMLQLCMGDGGYSLKGSSFYNACNVGKAGERIAFSEFMTPSGQVEYKASKWDLEGEWGKIMMEGAVTGFSTSGGFMICTRTDQLSTDTLLVLGRIVSGLDLLRRALRQYTTLRDTSGQYTAANGFAEESDASRIIITDSGVEII